MDKMLHACRFGAVPWVEELLASGLVVLLLHWRLARLLSPCLCAVISLSQTQG